MTTGGLAADADEDVASTGVGGRDNAGLDEAEVDIFVSSSFFTASLLTSVLTSAAAVSTTTSSSSALTTVAGLAGEEVVAGRAGFRGDDDVDELDRRRRAGDNDLVRDFDRDLERDKDLDLKRKFTSCSHGQELGQLADLASN